MRSVAATIFLGTGGIGLGVVMLSEGEAVSGQLSPQKEERPREQLDDASERCSADMSCCLPSRDSDKAEHVSCFWCTSEFDHYICPSASSFSEFSGGVERTDCLLAQEVKASFVL